MPQYQIKLHPTAKRELESLSDSTQATLTDRLSEVSKQEQPTSHPKAKHLRGQDDLFRVRGAGARAVCRLDKPDLRILKVGKRNGVYRDVDDLDDRLTA